MCIVIDINTLASVFKEDSKNHFQFKPVRDWIVLGKGKIVFGGTKYLSELKENYLSLFYQYKKAGKAILVQTDLIDADQDSIVKIIQHADFDDPHLVSLLRVSGCKLICSLDNRAYPFFRHALFFQPASNRPKIYSSLVNAPLLCDNNIAEICKPCLTTTKKQKAVIKF